MNDTPRGEVRKDRENKPETSISGGRERALPAGMLPRRDEPATGSAAAPVTYTLRVISGEGERGGALRTVLFQRLTGGESIEISAETDEPNLLAKLPDFLDAALEIQRALWPAQRVLSKLPSSFFPLLAEESRLVRMLTENREGAAQVHTRALERRRAAREAMIVRDVAWEALRGVLSPLRRREVDKLVGVDESAHQIIESMEAIAAYIERMMKDPDESALLVACDIDAAYAASLRRHATLLRAAEEVEGEAHHEDRKRPKRGLLRLIGTAYRVLRSEAFMTVPALHSMAWRMDSRADRAHRRDPQGRSRS